MGIFEIISAIVLILACVFIVIVVLMQDTKTQMSQTISGNSGDNYYGKNSGRTKEAQLNRAMVTAAIVFFVLALIVNVANAYFSGSKSGDTSSSPSSSVVSVSESSEGDDESGAAAGSTGSTDSNGSAEVSGTTAEDQQAESVASAAVQ